MVRMALAPDAKTVYHDALKTQMAHAAEMYDRRTTTLAKQWQAEGVADLAERLERRKVERDVFYGDEGRYAALLGYDAVYQQPKGGGWEGPYVAVVLNRAKLIVQDTGYDGGLFFGTYHDDPKARKYALTGKWKD